MQRYAQGRIHKGANSLIAKLKHVTRNINKKAVLKNGALALSAAFLFGVTVMGATFAWYAKDLPNPNSILDRDIPQSTKIFDRTGTHLLYEIALDEKRTLVTIDQIPLNVQKATITAEDRAFYEHNGFSFKGFGRSVFNFVTSFGRVRQGGSTITQQLVKNAILTNEKRLSRKIKELILSLALEQTYSKEQILQMYLNEIPYGSTNYGVESAAQAYFGKTVKDVTLAEAATLAALPQSPSRYLNDPERLKGRRDWILNDMAELGYITRVEADAALLEDTSVKISVNNFTAPHFVLWVKALLEEKYSARDVETGGLKVITSLDYDKQKLAEEAVATGVTANGAQFGFTSAGLISLDPKTGQILAMVGSPDYRNDDIDGQVNVTLQPLQPGSSIKPIVYAAAFEKGYTPNTLLWDTNVIFPTATGPYEPHNYDFGEHGVVSMRKALQGSLNIPAVKTLYLVGIPDAMKFIQRLGYTTINDASKLGLSMVLGGAEVTLLEHSAAYATFANSGVHHAPVAILKVEEPDGDVREEWKADEHKGEQAIAASLAATMSNVLSDNGARQYVFGPNPSFVLPGGRPVAMKTGTTNEFKDAWAMGYTPSLVAGVWVGNADGTKMKTSADGSKIAAPIWNQYMKNALGSSTVESFPSVSFAETGKPVLDGKLPATTVAIDTASGKLATPRTPARYRSEVICGEYHTILSYIDRENPLGDAPRNPERDPYYKVWEDAIQAYLGRHNAALKEGEKPMVSCTIPTEEDDVHVIRNVPEVRIQDPNNNGDVGRTFDVRLNVEIRRPLSRVEYSIDGSQFIVSPHMDGATITLPGWVGRGEHMLMVTVYDDVDNAGSDSVNINVRDEGSEGAFRITNPFNGQTIERAAPGASYQVAIEVPNANDLVNLTVFARNLWTGEETTVGTNTAPSSITSMSWALPAAADYMIGARGITSSGSILETIPLKVYVREPPQQKIIIIEQVLGTTSDPL